jgi:hypothetical protein
MEILKKMEFSIYWETVSRRVGCCQIGLTSHRYIADAIYYGGNTCNLQHYIYKTVEVRHTGSATS